MPENTKRDEEITRWMQSKLSLTRSMKDFDPAELTPQDWETIVSRCSNGWDWSGLLQKQPQFADKCPWDKLSGEDWSGLLQKQPQFADKCPWDELDGSAWSHLLQKQPQFADKCPWDKLSGEDWMDLLRGQPQFADKRPPARKE